MNDKSSGKHALKRTVEETGVIRVWKGDSYEGPLGNTKVKGF